ncbi:hypothetical protein TELCIR_18827 [Teladorsagia circumcincta]|uniref:25S rRNA (uridine-N(3))-methyltransferase BMT5-like domain-containing protein n=1 Tax=Teladorsagia circumcincta TaxID=45464 RepID=A0A2G9TQF8_TELCI|nr:hypothetical protein TELCIR_18827 [Teladorsagia circumcincta]
MPCLFYWQHFQRWFEVARSLLILGDGNLSFSRAVAESEPNLPVVATVLDSEAEFLTRYGDDRNIQRLRKCDNVQLLFGVDATALPLEWAGEFHYIVMNFPHPGGKTNLRKSRALASGIFRSVSSIMTDDSEFHLVLAQGQAGVQYNGGSPWSSSAPVHEKDSWQVLYLAADEGLLLDDISSFCPDAFDGYTSSGYRSSAKGFNNGKGAQRLIFRKSAPVTLLSEISTLHRPQGHFHILRPYFHHDVSFLFSDGNVDEGELLAFELLRQLTGSAVVEVREVEELRSMCPNPYLPNRIYRLTWQVMEVAVGKRACNKLQEELREKIQATIKERNLPLILT